MSAQPPLPPAAPAFVELTELLPRLAGPNEAADLTPWLAANIGRLGDAIGISLEATGTEVAVDTFAADILARNAEDGSAVLIENQLERSDHTHLGQILTYLAGLDARTVVWIAPEFRAAHLSAIRWLNQHTADGFSFFAVRLRVVRIADSPFAPILEVVERPNDWDRRVAATKARAEREGDPLSDTRLAFWSHYLARHPAAREAGITERRDYYGRMPLLDGRVVLSVWVAERNAGIFVGGGNGGGRKFAARSLLEPYVDLLCARLGAEATVEHPNGRVFEERRALSYADPANWDAIADWFEERRLAYAAAILEAVGEAP